MSCEVEFKLTFKVLKEDLIGYYREKEKYAPFAEQHEAEIINFYVRPPMMAYNKPKAFGQKKQYDEEKTRIRSNRELFLNGSDPYKGIYVAADAGMGKTSFAKMLAVTWCEAHVSKDQSFKIKSEMSCADEIQVKKKVLADCKTVIVQTFQAASETLLYTRENRSTDGGDADSFDTEDRKTMKIFDFLFLIKLREYKGSNNCSLDEMIYEGLIPKLPHECRYTREFLENVLYNKRCLIIVDGLDEWIHPKSCRKGEVIPHRRRWPECTVLTTTRPWKLSSARLSTVDIDRQVEISRLDETTAREIESRAIKILNENQRKNYQLAANNNIKTMTDFENSVPEKILRHILYIPFVLLQMICFWFKNHPIGKSLCEVDSYIIELTLTRWLVKTDSRHTDCDCEPAKANENIRLKCMENNRHCQHYMPLLLKIGKLAFLTLFCVIQEESLLFDKEQVLKYLGKEELKQCLNMGLLSQVKDPTALTKIRLLLYFPHKTLHEFFCALFIATNWKNADTETMSIKQTILCKCTSVDDILEMSEVFVFVSGLNPEVYSDISRHLATIVDADQNVIDYRNGVEEDSDLLVNYQHMQISCFLEHTRNQHPECKIVVEDMFVGRDVFSVRMEEDKQQALDSILSNSASSMKSLNLKNLPSAGRIVRIFEQIECPCLERLSVNSCELTLFQSVLNTTTRTLKYLKLDEVSLTDPMCRVLSTLNNLRDLYLDNVYVSRDSLNAISDCISGCMSLQKLRLDLPYKPFDTDGKCENREGDLSDTDGKREHRETSMFYLLTSIEAKAMLTYLCLRADVGQQTGVLDLSRHDRLQELDLSLPLTELHINTEQLVKCNVSRMDEFSSPAVSSLLAKLHGAQVLETLRLAGIRNSPPRIDITALPHLTEFTLVDFDLRDSTVTLTLPQLTEFTLDLCNLRDSTVTLSPDMTSLETIWLRGTRVNIQCCRELFVSISKLPQPITVKLQWIDMTAGEWRELLFDILGKLPKSIYVEITKCRRPSGKE